MDNFQQNTQLLLYQKFPDNFEVLHNKQEKNTCWNNIKYTPTINISPKFPINPNKK